MEQKETDLEYKSGLTTLQESAAACLASGKTITDTANNLHVSRATIYRMMQDGLFMAYYNFLCSEIKLNVTNNLFTLQEKAFEAIKAVLESDNDTTKLKAAMWIIEKIQEVKTGNTNPIQVLRNKSMNIGDVCNLGIDVIEFERLKKQHNL